MSARAAREDRDAVPAQAALAALLARSAARHDGRLCPRQVLGVRIGLYAGELLGLAVPRPDKRLLIFVETDGCFADGIAAATGCWLGRRTLRLTDYGKVAATAVDTATGRAVRVWPHPEARVRAGRYAPGAPDRWHAQRDGYRVMPAGELLQARAVVLTRSLDALLGRPGQRAICARCGEEILNGREMLLPEGPVCAGCAGGPYYRCDLQHQQEAEMTDSTNHDTAPTTDPRRDDAHPAHHLADPVGALALTAELARLRDEEPWRRSGRHTRTLIKDADLRVVLVALRPGARLDEHHAPGRITIHALAGRLRVGVAGQSIEVPTGHLVTLGPAIRHDVEALEESAFLLTIAWPTGSGTTSPASER